MNKKLHMSTEDIKKEFREAKDQEEQVKILADLNCVSEDVIREIVGLPPSKPRKRRKSLKEQSERICELYDQGFTDKEIAEKLGISRKSVAGWRHYRQLKPNPQRGSAAAALAGPVSATTAAEAPASEAPAEVPDVSVYAAIEAILCNIPQDAGRDVRLTTLSLSLAMLDENLRRRLHLAKEDANDQ